MISTEVDRRSANRSSDSTGTQSSVQDKTGSDVKTLDNRHHREANKHGVLVPSHKCSRGDDAKLVYGHQKGADDVAPNTGTTIGAACVLASDFSRHASRHGELAFELLHMSEGHGPDSRSFAAVPEGMAALGQSVGLQASAVGLMDEVVVRTVHSRVSDGP